MGGWIGMCVCVCVCFCVWVASARVGELLTFPGRETMAEAA